MSNILTAQHQIIIDEAIKELFQQETERCTIVHCKYFTHEVTAARIWESTFLIEETDRKCKLIKAFNIFMMPFWTQYFIYNDYFKFTLVFEGKVV